jgi:hypothetical protein
MGAANTRLAEHWDVDFKLESATPYLHPDMAQYRTTDPMLAHVMRRQVNVIKEWRMVVRVVKP